MFKLAVIAFCAQALVQTAYSQCIPSLGAANLNFVPNININSLGSSNCGLNSLGASNIALNSLGGPNINVNSLGGPNINVNSLGGQTGYGGSGTGEFVAVGELPVTGMTAVDGSVPVYGIVQFNGNIPAGGIVTVLGNTPNICSCSCPGLAY
ncbi:unnamed protein product [Plutella xylostella]|uniref:(diamondback moth) hypothetical protein n=1 Tax=Plutella xylostella TaxID=51655 RepID=A0A8S4FZU9_PLUXY|nr:unnamed protein product [Plutella xylostella]